jgi:4-coumarate--CoA ligase
MGSCDPFSLIHFILELEGHLLNHKYVADVCVVSVLDEYSGEVPLAFVVPHASLAQKIKNEAKEAQKVKAELLKVRMTL